MKVLFKKSHPHPETIYPSIIVAMASLLYIVFIWRTAFPVNGQNYFTLVDDEWGKLASFMAGRPEFERLDNDIYIRRDSKLLDANGLSQSYRK